MSNSSADDLKIQLPPPDDLPPLPTFRNPKHRHLSRSAAKRESIQLLGSIKDLQAHFSRAGSVEHRSGSGVGVRTQGLPPTFTSPATTIGTTASSSTLTEEEFRSLPEGMKALERDKERNEERLRWLEGKRRKPWKDVDLPRVVDIGEARLEAGKIVREVKGRWGLSLVPSSPSIPLIPQSSSTSSTSYSNPSSPTSSKTIFPSAHLQSSDEIRSTFISTAQAIRRIKTLSLSVSGLPNSQSTQGGRRVSTPALLPSRLSLANKHRSGISTPSRPGTTLPRAVSTGSQRKGSLPPVGEIFERPLLDLPGELRKAALDVLGALRHLEERLRLDSDSSSSRDNTFRSDTGKDAGHQGGRTLSPIAQSSTGSSSAQLTDDTAPSTSTRPGSSVGLYSDPSSIEYEEEEEEEEEEEYNLNALAAEETRVVVTWEERLVMEQRDYRILAADEWANESEDVSDGLKRWCDVVGRMFFGGSGEVDKELEGWARDEWRGKDLERVQAFLLAHLSGGWSDLLPEISDRDAFLSRLADGYLLVQAYNTAIADSPRSWGFIPDEDVHDTLSTGSSLSNPASTGEDIKGKEREWTFRRVGNLTAWAAAIRLRYNLPIKIAGSSFQQPTTFLPQPSSVDLKSAPSKTNISQPPTPQLASTDRVVIPTRPLPDQVATGSSATSMAPRGGGNNMPKIDFDPLLVARKGEGWEEMMMGLMAKWIEEAAREIRDRRGEGEVG